METNYHILTDFEQWLKEQDEFLISLDKYNFETVAKIHIVIAGIMVLKNDEEALVEAKDLIEIGIGYVFHTVEKLSLYIDYFKNDENLINRYSLVIDTLLEVEETLYDFEDFKEQEIDYDIQDFNFLRDSSEYLDTVINEKRDLSQDKHLYEIIQKLEGLYEKYGEQLLSISRIYELVCDAIIGEDFEEDDELD